MEQRFTFDQVADVYKTSRPSYPDALIEDVIAYAALDPDDCILEVGCGTGLATAGFARKGYAILATDPGADMLRGARDHLREFDNVDYLQATFETLPESVTGFRLIIAAQSFHWIAPEVRFVKATKVLLPGGALAVFGHVPVRVPERLGEMFRRIYMERVGRWAPAPETGYLPTGPFKRWYDESGLFGPVTHKCYPWVWQHTTASYVAFHRTRSDHQMLAAEKGEQLLADLAQAIDDEGGRFDIDYETHLYMARLA